MFTKETLNQLKMSLETEIEKFGKKIFEGIGQAQPSGFNKKNFAGKVMEWSMTKPEFKVNMFRLIDVMPALKTNRAVASHINQYLAEAAKELGSFFGWAANVNPGSFKAMIAATTAKKSIEQMAKLFIAGDNPKSALKALRKLRKSRIAFTVDLLGEYSLSEREALNYLARYEQALDVLAKEIPKWKSSKAIMEGNPGSKSPVNVSVKLSALYSQCSPLNFNKSVEVLTERLSIIARKAKKSGAMIYVDAEDSSHNPIIYETFKQVFSSDEFRDFYYPGIVVQAYTKDCKELILDLLQFAKSRGNPIAVRLVKGAYWDQETIIANQNHWEPVVFKNKADSDLQYEAVSKILLENHKHFLPAFGSHNIRSLAHACCYAKQLGLSNKDFELQMLYGMAEPIAKAFTKEDYLVRMYVPVGKLIPGMGYLVRRLLENTSNESFLRHSFFDEGTQNQLLKSPLN